MIRENLWLASSSTAPDYDRVIIFVTYFFLDSWNILDCWSSKKCPKHGGKTWGKQKKEPQIVTPIEEKCANNCLLLASKQLSTRIQMKINWQINSQELKEAKLYKRKMSFLEEQEVDIQYLKGYDILRKMIVVTNLCCFVHCTAAKLWHTHNGFQRVALAHKVNTIISPTTFHFLTIVHCLKKSAQLGLCCYLLLLWVYNWHPEDAQGNH